MPSIAGSTVTGFRGRMRRATQRIAVLDTDAGYDGFAIVKAGWASEVSSIVTAVDLVGGVNVARDFRDSYYRLHGQVITVVDQFGLYWYNTTVINVVADFDQTIIANIYRLTASWKFLTETVRP